MKFTKMEGLGNDYVYINCFEETIQNPSELAIRISDRHFGVGGDGLILILASTKADAQMRMFNADGSEAGMCGNGIRCVGKYLYDHHLVQKKVITIETLAGIKNLQLETSNDRVVSVRVDMGEPILDPALIPIKIQKKSVIAEPIEVNGRSYQFTGVSMGNPHCIIFIPAITNQMVLQDGPTLEVHPYFPHKTNVEFIEVLTKDLIRMRVWERGSGETMACGTGACAAVVAAILNGLTNPIVTVKLLGGDLKIEWEKDSNRVFMTGPAIEVFQGVWPSEFQ